MTPLAILSQTVTSWSKVTYPLVPTCPTEEVHNKVANTFAQTREQVDHDVQVPEVSEDEGSEDEKDDDALDSIIFNNIPLFHTGQFNPTQRFLLRHLAARDELVR